jgi:hypothetical protein
LFTVMTGIFTPAYSVSKRTGSDGPATSRWTGTASSARRCLPSRPEDRWRVPRLVCPSRERRRPPSACGPASSPAPCAAPVACPACCPTCSVAWPAAWPSCPAACRRRRRPPGRHRQRRGRCRRPPRHLLAGLSHRPHPGRRPAWRPRRPGPAPGCPPRRGPAPSGRCRPPPCGHRLEQRLQDLGLRSIVGRARSRMS